MERAEAIKIIKTATVYTPEEMEALETLIPELKESREEQIRKAIIKSLDLPFMEAKIDGTDVTYEEAVSWLEKQKEQKDYRKLYEDIAKSEWFKKAYEGKSLGCDDEQKEQKPADEQFPPLEGLDAIKAKYYDDGFKNGFDEGVDSVKPAEWSEEDEKNLELIIDCIYTFYPDPVMKYKLKDWLNSLRPSWKPSKEQMEALRKVAYKMGNACLGKGFANDENLHSLYVALKKLM